MKKRVLSLVLVLVMCLGLLPMTALAAEEGSDFIVENGVLTGYSYSGAGGDITIPDGVTSIGRSAFRGCWNVTSVTIPEGVTTIEDQAFHECKKLASVTIPGSVTSIGKEAFTGCILQGEPGSYVEQYVKDNASGHNYFVSTEYPEFVVDGTTLIKYAGPAPENKIVEIPDWITSVKSGAFENTGVKRVIVPDSVTECGRGSFAGIVQANMGSYAAKELVRFSNFTYSEYPDFLVQKYDSRIILTNYIGSDKDIVIPDCVQSISNGGCFCDGDFTSLTIPASVTIIGESQGYTYGPSAFTLFLGCKNFTDIHYKGTKAQWAAIKFDDVSEKALDKVTIHCSDGDLTWAETKKAEKTLTYTITLDPMGGTVEPASFSLVYGGGTALPTPVRPGYTFAGWTDDLDRPRYLNSYLVSKREDVTLYAQWKNTETYTITFDAMGGTVSPASLEVIEKGRFPRLPAPVKTRYIFQGWFDAPVGGNQFKAGEAVALYQEDQILYAQWASIDRLLQEIPKRRGPRPENHFDEQYLEWQKANEEMLEGGIDEKYYVNTIVTPDVQAKSDEICRGLTTDEEKIYAIHSWVTSNIYYDYPILNKEAEAPTLTAQVVLERGSSICSGYAVLTQALCWAQKIPCVYVVGESTEGYHAWNAVLFNGEWRWMDTTWDTYNAYYGGDAWIQGSTRPTYFCIIAEFMSADHRARYIQAVNGFNADLPKQTAEETKQLLKRERELEEDKNYLVKLAENAKKDPTLSDWAKEEVAGAIQQNLVPRELMGSYGSAVTREEFCGLMVTLLERRSGKSIAAFAASKGAEYRMPFRDTNDINVGYAYALGIVNGVSDTEFNPAKSISRQEAATMLARTGKVLGLGAKTGMSFSDQGGFADWAADSIAYISGLTDPISTKRVMGGTGDGNFSPLGTYSRQQAVVTALRIFHCAGQY